MVWRFRLFWGGNADDRTPWYLWFHTETYDLPPGSGTDHSSEEVMQLLSTQFKGANHGTDEREGVGMNITLQEKLMAVRLNCSYSFGRVTDRQITAETNAAKSTHALTVRKELLPQDSGTYLKALQSTLAEFYQYHCKVSMSSVNKGERLLPVAFYMEYMQEYGAYDALVKDKFQDFQTNYVSSVRRAQQLLGPAFNAGDYPDIQDLPQYLRFKVTTIPLPVADTLLSVVGESVQVDVDAYLQESMREALSSVNERVKDCLTRMVDQLSNPKGKVYDSLTGSLLELVSFIPSFNVTEDDSLTLLAAEIKDKLLVHNTEALRTDPVVRRDVAAEAADILRRMS